MPRYIDADFLIDKLKEQANIPWNKRAVPVSWSYAYKEFIDDIENAPTADVEPVRHGRWYENNIGDAVCSNCKGIQDKYEVVFMPYCPNCGCKLDLEKEEEKK
jgi:hypothetical protein